MKNKIKSLRYIDKENLDEIDDQWKDINYRDNHILNKNKKNKKNKKNSED